MDVALDRGPARETLAPPIDPSRPALWTQLSRYLPILVTLTTIAVAAEGIAGVAFDEPILAASAAMSAAFGAVVVACGLLVHLGHVRWVPILMAGAVYLLGVVSAALLPGIEAGASLLPILSVVLLLPGHGRRTTFGIVGLALAGSALVFVLAGQPHPFPPLREPLRSIFPPAVVLGVAVLILGSLADFANQARGSIEAMRRSMEHQQAAQKERLAVISSLSALQQRETAHATAIDIAAALADLPGVDVAGVFGMTSRGLEVLALVGPSSFPIKTGDIVPADRATERLARLADGPWGQIWEPGTDLSAYGQAMDASGMRALAFGPIVHGGLVVGLIVVATADQDRARHLVSDLPAVGEFGASASALLAPQLAELLDLAESRRRVEAIISAVAFQPVFQPIVDLAHDQTVGFEALTRFDDGRPPNIVFDDATSTGLGLALEAVTLAAAMREAHRLPREAWLSLNVSPELVVEHERLAAILSPCPRRIVIEITEHVQIADYRAVREGVAALGANVRLAVDDAGAGIANFGHIVELRAEVIKIDISLIRDIDTDLTRQALVVGLVHFAAQTGSEVVAEGIETDAERATVRSLGVSLGQGYLMGRPTRIETIAPTEDPGLRPAA
jgi:EAL domain-containing protein (putative c-di-GMP-specific phosphodiesterase class I)